MKDFRSLLVWEKSHQFALDVYSASKRFPKDELFGLTSQIRRSSASIPTNIAEGCGRGTDADFGRFLQIAMGSSSESEYQLILSRELGYLDTEKYNQLIAEVTEIKRMLTALMSKLR